MSDQDSSSSQMTPEMLLPMENADEMENLLTSLDHLDLDKYDGRHGKPLGSVFQMDGVGGERLDLIMERDLLQMEQNQRLMTESRSYSMLVSQLESQLTRVQTKCDEQSREMSSQAREISALQQKCALQTVQGEQKFNQFLVCANQYEQSKAKEIEALKLKLSQQEHMLNSMRSELDHRHQNQNRAQHCGHQQNHVNNYNYQQRFRVNGQQQHQQHQQQQHSPTSSSSSESSCSNGNGNGAQNGNNAQYFEHMSVSQLEQLRVRQKNIVYIIGLPVSLCNAKLLKSNKWFGKFGVISRICFNTSPKCVKANSIPTFVTFTEERDALQAIRRMNLYCLADGTRLKTNFGRTKYCPLFCRKEACLNEKCKFLHAWAEHDDIITEQEITDFNAIRAGPPSRYNRK